LPHHRHLKSREAPRATALPVPGGPDGHRPISFGILSSAPPTHCGLATFSAALGGGLVARGARVSIVRVRDEADHSSSSSLPVIAEMVAGDPASIDRTVRALNRCDVVLVQHEYGLFGGRDGADVLAVLDGLRVPVVATLHTVLPSPTDHQRAVLDAVLDRVEAAVVMSDRAEAILRRVNAVGDTPVVVIPHGAAVAAAPAAPAGHDRPVLLTWGLIGPGKGIQWVIDALAGLTDLDPAPLYVIAGQTHPKVLAHEGDAYRRSLVRRVAERGVGHLVRFDNSYFDLDGLGELIASADAVILPYDSRDQATSGVLVDAVAAGRPVIATAFPHAVELLGSGAGVVVAHGDVAALRDAIRRVVTDRSLAAEIAAEASRVAPSLSWDAVARQYSGLAHRVRDRVRAAV
jgi:polysaccharide biosynthesis protein PslF